MRTITSFIIHSCNELGYKGIVWKKYYNVILTGVFVNDLAEVITSKEEYKEFMEYFNLVLFYYRDQFAPFIDCCFFVTEYCSKLITNYGGFLDKNMLKKLMAARYY